MSQDPKMAQNLFPSCLLLYKIKLKFENNSTKNQGEVKENAKLKRLSLMKYRFLSQT
jgi:hypothetical protein